MLQHKWTIHQGNVACLSLWPGQAAARPPTQCFCLLHGQFVRSVFVCPCVSRTGRLVGSYTEGRVLAAAAILVKSLLLRCWGPSRWSHTDPRVQQKLV